MSDIDNDNIKEEVPSPEAMDENSFDDPSTSRAASKINNSDGMEIDSLDNSLPLILTAEYFVKVKRRTDTFHQRTSNGVSASCVMCKKKISGSTKVTSNFLQHYKNKHPEMHRRYLGEKGKVPGINRNKKKKSNFDEKLVRFVIETFSPPSIVENSAFRSLFEGTNLLVKSSQFITDLIDDKYNEMIVEIKEKLGKADYVCCTADVWTGKGKSVFGYTCHWIDSEFRRTSYALACRRFNNQTIADIISEINSQFGINEERVVSTVTENGNYFAKAFDEFGVKRVDPSSNDQDGDAQGWLVDDETTFDSSSLEPHLSKHMRCASHTLNQIAATDFIKALRKSPKLYEKHQNAMKKCTQIWNKYYLQKTEEPLNVNLPKLLKIPTMTRWNSLYSSLEYLLSFSDRLKEMTKALELEDFDPAEVEYLQEYCQFMKPISECLDFLQKDPDIYFGYLAPTLLTLKANMNKFVNSATANWLKDIANEMQEVLFDRFRPFFELQASCHDIVIAAITCPPIKIINSSKLLKIWKKTAPDCSAAYLTDIFVKKVIDNGPLPMDASEKKDSSDIKLHPFFSLEDSDDDDSHHQHTDNKNMESSNITRELKGFLGNGNNTISTLNEYPNIKRMFYEFNTPLPSSAPVERLFSFAEIVSESCRQDLTDDHFEKLMMMRINNK